MTTPFELRALEYGADVPFALSLNEDSRRLGLITLEHVPAVRDLITYRATHYRVMLVWWDLDSSGGTLYLAPVER